MRFAHFHLAVACAPRPGLELCFRGCHPGAGRRARMGSRMRAGYHRRGPPGGPEIGTRKASTGVRNCIAPCADCGPGGLRVHDVPRDNRAPRNAATTEAPPSAPTAEPTSGGSLRDEGSAPIRRPRRRRRLHGWVAAALQQHGRHGRGNAFVRVCPTHPRNEALLGDAPRRLMTRAGCSGRATDGGSVLRVRVAAQYGQTTLSWILPRVAALLQVSLG